MERFLILFNFLLLPKSILHNKGLLWQFVKRNIAVKYKGSMLGLIWSIAHPLLMLCVYTFVFSVVLKAKWGIEGNDSQGAFAIIMFCGMALYNIFSESVMASCGSVCNNPNFVKKVVFPLEILPLSQTVSAFILGVVWFVLLFIGEIAIIGNLSWTMLLLPLIVIPLFCFSLGISFFVSSLSVYIRDTQYVLGVILQVLFFVTPIFYPIGVVPEDFRIIMLLNPLTSLVENTRQVFIYGECPDWYFLGESYLIAIIVLHLGVVWFYKTKKGFADVL